MGESFGAAITFLEEQQVSFSEKMPFRPGITERFPVMCPHCKSAMEIEPHVVMCEFGINSGVCECPQCGKEMRLHFSVNGCLFSFSVRLELPVRFTVPPGEYCWFGFAEEIGAAGFGVRL